MSSSSRDPVIPDHLADRERELTHVRQALLDFSESEGLLPGLVAGEDTDPQRLHPDVDSARRGATVDELLWLVGGAPHPEQGLREDEVHPLYASLLAVAEAFDILIDQFSLVYGDAVALAQSIWPEWHAMSGCHGHDASPEQAAEALERVRTEVEALPELLGRVTRLPADERERVAARFHGWSAGTLVGESRHLARHALDTWMPRGIEDPEVAAALVPPTSATAVGAFAAATADLMLASACRGTCRPQLIEALVFPFSSTPGMEAAGR